MDTRTLYPQNSFSTREHRLCLQLDGPESAEPAQQEAKSNEMNEKNGKEVVGKLVSGANKILSEFPQMVGDAVNNPAKFTQEYMKKAREAKGANQNQAQAKEKGSAEPEPRVKGAGMDTLQPSLGQAKIGTETANNFSSAKGYGEKIQSEISTQIKEAQKTIKQAIQEMQSNPDIADRIASMVSIIATLVSTAGGILRRIFAPGVSAPNPVITAPNASPTVPNVPSNAPPSAPNAPGSAPDVLDRDMRTPLNLAQNPRASADRLQTSIESQTKERDGLEKQDRALQEELNKLDRATAGIKRRREIRELQNKIDEQLFQINSRINAAQTRIKELRAEQQRRNDLVTQNISRPPALLATLEGDRIDLTYAYIRNLQSLPGIPLMTKLINSLPVIMRTNPDGSVVNITTDGGILRMHNAPPLFFTQEVTQSIGQLLRQLAESGSKGVTMNPKEHEEAKKRLDAFNKDRAERAKETTAAVNAFNANRSNDTYAAVRKAISAERQSISTPNLNTVLAGNPDAPTRDRIRKEVNQQNDNLDATEKMVEAAWKATPEAQKKAKEANAKDFEAIKKYLETLGKAGQEIWKKIQSYFNQESADPKASKDRAEKNLADLQKNLAPLGRAGQDIWKSIQNALNNGNTVPVSPTEPTAKKKEAVGKKIEGERAKREASIDAFLKTLMDNADRSDTAREALAKETGNVAGPGLIAVNVAACRVALDGYRKALTAEQTALNGSRNLWENEPYNNARNRAERRLDAVVSELDRIAGLEKIIRQSEDKTAKDEKEKTAKEKEKVAKDKELAAKQKLDDDAAKKQLDDAAKKKEMAAGKKIEDERAKREASIDAFLKTLMDNADRSDTAREALAKETGNVAGPGLIAVNVAACRVALDGYRKTLTAEQTALNGSRNLWENEPYNNARNRAERRLDAVVSELDRIAGLEKIIRQSEDKTAKEKEKAAKDKELAAKQKLDDDAAKKKEAAESHIENLNAFNSEWMNAARNVETTVHAYSENPDDNTYEAVRKAIAADQGIISEARVSKILAEERNKDVVRSINEQVSSHRSFLNDITNRIDKTWKTLQAGRKKAEYVEKQAGEPAKKAEAPSKAKQEKELREVESELNTLRERERDIENLLIRESARTQSTAKIRKFGADRKMFTASQLEYNDQLIAVQKHIDEAVKRRDALRKLLP